MPTTQKKTTSTITKKPAAKKPKKGSIEAVILAFEEARKNNLDLSFLKRESSSRQHGAFPF